MKYSSSELAKLQFVLQNQRMSDLKKEAQKNTCPSNQDEEDNQSSSSLHFDLLTLNQRKNSQQSDFQSFHKQSESFISLEANYIPTVIKQGSKQKKAKLIEKQAKDIDGEKKINFSRKRKIAYLESKIQDLERQIASLRRNEHYCLCCKSRLPQFYQQKLEPVIASEYSAPNSAGDSELKKNSRDSLQFQKIDFHSPLIQSQEMQEKMWIFVGTMLIAMGSKVTDFDGTINTFKVLKQSVDAIRKQVDKCLPKIGLQFFCCKQEMHQPQGFIDGMIFDPFYSQKQEMSAGHFSLEGIKIESVEEYQLFYDSKYHFNIKYDALLTIMEFARDNCSIS